jgi:hypothetical protein
MRTTLDIADEGEVGHRELAAQERRSIGAVISDLARRGLTPERVETSGRFPVIRSPAGAPPITPEMVRRALDKD